MSDPASTRYDEDRIDLLGVLETLWAGKFAILASAVLPLLAGLGLSLTSTPSFKVEAPYTVLGPTLAVFASDICDNVQCRQDGIADRVVSLSGGGWRSVDSGSALVLTTTSPRTAAEYQYDLEELNKMLRADLLKEAEALSTFIQTELDSDFRQMTVVAMSLLQAKRMILSLQPDSLPLIFEAVSITESKQDLLRAGIVCAFLGALVGCVYVLVRRAFQDRALSIGQDGR